MINEPSTARLRSRLTLIAIAAMFVAPIVLAWLLSTGTLDLRSRELINRGELLTPPIDLSPERARPGFAPLFKLAPSEWAMVALEPVSCTDSCARRLDQLLVIRELLGQGAVRVTVHAITAAAAPEGPHAARIHVDPEALAWLTRELAARNSVQALPTVVLVDWRHQLMLRYASDDRRGLQKDLKRLLRASAIR